MYSNDPNQSLSLCKKSIKYSKYEDVTLENRENYFKVSSFPIRDSAENDMELLSDLVTWGEMYLNNWEEGFIKT